MVLEGMIKPLKAEKKPFELFFLGIIFSSVAIVFGLFVFSPYSSIVSIALTAIVCVPIIYGVIKMEEKKCLEIKKELLLVKEHGRALLFFLFLFFGFVISFAAWYTFLPEPYLGEVFSVQTETISGVTNAATGAAVSTSGIVADLVSHNIKVLLFCLLFAFFYGFGAIFILTWNASVVGAAIGDAIRSSVSTGFFSAITTGLSRYLIHGIPEIAAYFTAGLAGGIISIAVINHDFKGPMFKNIVKDSTGLVLISVALIVISAFLEVYVSPLV
ncbi:stage II sporulation protein M [Nanoarchaeota archaeon]